MAARSELATGIPTGRLGVWWFLGGEIVIFGGLVACYILLRLHHPEWAVEAAHTQLAIGALNTFVLLTSSLTMVQAYACVDRGRPQRALIQLGATAALGTLFLAIKTFEYRGEIAEGYTPTRNLFWSFYYAMTGLHALHVLAGIVAILVVMAAVRRREALQRVEYVGLYWHFVDIVWIFLFPLLYIASGS